MFSADHYGTGHCPHVYETQGFNKVASYDKSEWGDSIIEERWEISL